MGRWFYDSEINSHIVLRKARELEIKKMLKKSTHIIVPHFFIGHELVELWNIHEQKIDILPMISVKPIKDDESVFLSYNISRDFFLYDATFGIEANMGVLLRQFARYVHEFGGKNDLVLHGYSAPYIKSLTQIITSENLIGRVHITGCLDISARESLYKKAKAWVFIGAYNTTKTNIALAKTYNLPLVLSDIKSFQNYKNAIKIHPNHTEELA